ncbi:MAG: UDP-N-acetylmuramoyl-tripeptide--D-alanyl-D-alanine ligase [Candidatus Neomarinimicrobiota bacterium]
MAKEINAEFIRALKYGQVTSLNGRVSGAAIDSRKAGVGTLFFALKGEKADGHAFVRESIDKGAALCVVSTEWADQNPTENLPLWIVDSPETALHKLATAWRNRFDIPVLGITGTNGKTTTRSMCSEILKRKFAVHSTAGNFNNQLGLPLTLLELNDRFEFSILEMGTNHFGEIAALCKIACPTAGLITNIGHGHVEYFGDLAGVQKAKAELFQSLPKTGVAFINSDDTLIREIPCSASQFTYGFESGRTDIRGKILTYNFDGYPEIEVNERIKIQMYIPGNTAAINALAACAVGIYFGVPEEEIVNALENYQPVDQRFKIIRHGGFSIINDTYNANPDSTIAALKTLLLMKTNGRRIFVFGNMLELGEFTETGHSIVGKTAADLKIDKFYATGEFTQSAITAARNAGLSDVTYFDTKSELLSDLKKSVSANDIVLVKGSRGSRMEEIIKGLTE